MRWAWVTSSISGRRVKPERGRISNDWRIATARSSVGRRRRNRPSRWKKNGRYGRSKAFAVRIRIRQPTEHVGPDSSNQDECLFIKPFVWAFHRSFASSDPKWRRGDALIRAVGGFIPCYDWKYSLNSPSQGRDCRCSGLQFTRSVGADGGCSPRCLGGDAHRADDSALSSSG